MKMLILTAEEVLLLTINIRIIFEVAAEVLDNYRSKSENFIIMKSNFLLIVKLLNKLCNCNSFS